MTKLAHKMLEELPSTNPASSVVEMIRIPQITLHAFCNTPDMITAMGRVVADRRFSRSDARVHPGGIDAAISMYRQVVSPDLVIIECQSVVAGLYAQLAILADVCLPRTRLIVIGYVNDVTLYRELMIRGVSEYIVAPVEPIALIGVISRIYQIANASKLGRTLAFIGANGGVGSSTIARNVAGTIARSGRFDVILADLDMPFGSASLGFNLSPTQGMAQALQDVNGFDEVLLKRLSMQCEEHLSVLTAPATLEQSYDLEESAFERVLNIAQSSSPFLVLDIPHVWTSWVKKTLLAADEIVITAVPDLIGLRNAKNLVDLLKQVRPNDGPPRLVLNQIGVPKRSEISPDKFGDVLQTEPIACIPFDPMTVSTAANSGRMIADVSARSAVSKSLTTIAETISGRASVKKRPKSWFAISGLFGG
jgi:pilus assembly protein CpaE